MENEEDRQLEEAVQEMNDVMYNPDHELQKEPVGMSYNKQNLLDQEKTITVNGFGLNRWGEKQIMCVIDGEEVRLRISGKNKNELIDILGNKVGDWIGKQVKVKGEVWEGDVRGEQRTGVSLTFFA